MDGGQAATLITAVGGFIAGVGGIALAFRARRDQAERDRAQEERDDAAAKLALRTASREDLQAVIAAQRAFIEDSEHRVDRLQNQLSEANARIDEQGAQLAACTEGHRAQTVEIQALRRRVAELEPPS